MKEQSNMGGGKQESTASGRNTKIRQGFPPDHSGAFKTNRAMREGKLSGSVDNLSHSLSGASAKQRHGS